MKIYPDNHKIYPGDWMKFCKSTKNVIIHVMIDQAGNTFKVPIGDLIKFCDGKKKE